MAAVAEMFDRYRHHYGEPVVAGQTLPASLRLGCSWQLRDLYVVPETRRRGVGRALVQAVRAAASAAGAIRLSVQTEPANAAALQLYRTSGFAPVEGIQILVLDLPPTGN